MSLTFLFDSLSAVQSYETDFTLHESAKTPVSTRLEGDFGFHKRAYMLTFNKRGYPGVNGSLCVESITGLLW